MKKLLMVLLAVVCLTSCTVTPVPSRITPALAGEHTLRKFNKDTYVSSSWSASYFLIFGSAHGKEKEERRIAFSWLSNDSTYIYSTVTLDKVRIKFDNQAEEPYVTFYNLESSDGGNWEPNPNTDMQEIMDGYIGHIVIHCRPEDYSKDVNLNQLK